MIDANNHKNGKNPNEFEINFLATDEANIVGDQMSSYWYHITWLYIWLYKPKLYKSWLNIIA